MDTAEQSKQLSVRSRTASPRFWSAAAAALICLLSASSVQAQEIWHHREDPTPPFGDMSQPGYAITDSQGNVIVSGQLPHASGNNGVVAKYAPDGTKLWVHGQPGLIIGPGYPDLPDGALAKDDADNIYSVSGLPTQPSPNTVQLIKYAPDGTRLLSTQTQITTDGITIDGLVVDSATGESYVYGAASRFVSGGQQVEDAYVTKFDATGHQLWIRTLPGSATDANRFKSGVLDSQGRIVLANVDQSGSGQTGTETVSIVKYETDGTLLYNSQLPKPAANYYDVISSNMLIDSSDNVYIGGSTGYSVLQNMLIAKFSPDGTEIWKREYGYEGSVGNGQVNNLAFDSSDNIIVAVTTENSNPNNYQSSPTFLKYTPAGSKVWARTDVRTGNDNFSVVGLATSASDGGFYAEEQVQGFSFSSFGYLYSAATCKFDAGGHKVAEKDYRGSSAYPYEFAPNAMAYDSASDSVFMIGSGIYPSAYPNMASWETIKYQFGQ